ncbi:hypothetical protein [Georgenia muralis]|uniref:Uncharacterized protein n=1 Tax=Georgenia muralis TaxID=154117 RepID=A0A3N5A344_9MICO|nr:hypothetical protein [Georgenia muralis]RPF26251.1 hypothetical protein EDD32_0685 [Georgenia muralis]
MDLEIRQHESFQRREWTAQRIGWVALALFVLAGLVGLLGTGPLSWTVTESDGGLVTVEYDRIAHHEADESLTLIFAADAVQDGVITAELTGPWLSGVDVQSISPEPSEQLAVPGGVILELPVERPGEIEMTLTFRAAKYGRLDGEITVGADTVAVSQLVLP